MSAALLLKAFVFWWVIGHSPPAFTRSPSDTHSDKCIRAIERLPAALNYSRRMLKEKSPADWCWQNNHRLKKVVSVKCYATELYIFTYSKVLLNEIQEQMHLISNIRLIYSALVCILRGNGLKSSAKLEADWFILTNGPRGCCYMQNCD